MFTKKAPPFAKGAPKKKGKPAAKTAGPPPAWQGIGNKMLAGKPGPGAC